MAKDIKRKTPQDGEQKIIVHMRRTKDTKGTYVFTNDEEGVAIPALYVKKSAFPDGAPESIKVVIRYDP